MLFFKTFFIEFFVDHFELSDVIPKQWVLNISDFLPEGCVEVIVK